MNEKIAPVLGFAGSFGAWFAGNYDRALSAAVSVVSLAFLLWQWRRQSRQGRKGPR